MEEIVTKNKEQILMDIDLKKIKEKGEIMFKDVTSPFSFLMCIAYFF
ncbi:hypothetical protein [Peribacillus butanolivorans]